MASLKNLSVAELRRELARREAGGSRLQAKRANLAKALDALDAELADLGVDGAPRRRGRKPGPKPGRRAGRKPGRPAKAGDGRSRRMKNALTLLQAILKGVPAGRTVSPAEAAVAAKKAGYRSAGRKFGQQVATCLAKAKEFRKRARGQYQRMGGASATKAAKAPKAKKAGRKASKSGRKFGRPKGSRNKPKAAAQPAPVKAEVLVGQT